MSLSSLVLIFCHISDLIVKVCISYVRLTVIHFIFLGLLISTTTEYSLLVELILFEPLDDI